MSVKAARVSALIISLSLVAQILISCAKEADQAQEGVRWLVSFEEALRVAEKKNLPIMMDFYADWCGWCKRLDADTYVNEDVVSRAEEFVSVRIDADVESDLSSRYKIAGLPTIVFIDHTGREIHRVVGYRPARDFVTEMNHALEAFRGRVGT